MRDEQRVPSGAGVMGEPADAASRQIVRFHRKHYDAIVRGEKVTTVRWNEAIRPGSSLFVFDEYPTAPPIGGMVTAVEPYPLPQLTPRAARQPPGTDMAEFAEQLRANYYPDMPDDATVEVVLIAIDPAP